MLVFPVTAVSHNGHGGIEGIKWRAIIFPESRASGEASPVGSEKPMPSPFELVRGLREARSTSERMKS